MNRSYFLLDTSSTDDSAFSSRKIYSASVPKHITNIRDRRSMHLDEDSDDEYDPVSHLAYPKYPGCVGVYSIYILNTVDCNNED